MPENHDQSVKPFWQAKGLHEMNAQEWESLCDGCAQCCLLKLEDEDTQEVFVTSVACRQLDINHCRCRDYAQRAKHVEMCLIISLDKPEIFNWLPMTCAYRCLYEGRPLPDWHPLVSQEPGAVHAAGISVKGYAISEEYIHPQQLDMHVIGKL